MAEKQSFRVFEIYNLFSGVDSRYFEDLAVQASRAGNAFHQGIGAEGMYLEPIKAFDLVEALGIAQALYADFQADLDPDMGIITLTRNAVRV